MTRILFADNDLDFLETRSEFLEKAGYKIIKASSPADAERCLREVWTPVAILDIRLENDDDDKDWSGVTLAKSKLCRAITKIVLTNFPSALINELLALASGDSQQIVVKVLHKQDGPEALINAIQTALAHHVHINWNLVFDPKGLKPFALTPFIESGLEGERLLNRAEELEDLFRRLFYEKDRIRIDRLLWQRDGRVALAVLAFKGTSMDPFVVTCGQNAPLVDEAQRYHIFAPHAPGDLSTVLNEDMTAETTHFAANAYTLTQADLETVRSLGEVYRAGDKKVFALAVEMLFEKTLAMWQGSPAPAGDALEALYRGRLGLTGECISPQAFQARWHALVQHIPSITRSVANPEPITTLLQSVMLDQPTLKIKSPGAFMGDSILVDANGHAWLTDFADAGDVPQFWNFVALESAIRFDWVEEKNLQRLEEIEKSLLDDSHFSRPDPQSVESPFAKQAVRSIQQIRRLAVRTVGREYLQYHLGIFFHAARRFADFDPAVPPTPNEQARLAHALMAMAMIAAKIKQDKPDALPTRVEEAALELDEDNHCFKFGTKLVSLSPQEFKLAHYLFENEGRTCTYHKILKEVYQEKYGEEYLQTMIDRIRGKIEPEERSPHYILNVRSVGYRLVRKPDE